VPDKKQSTLNDIFFGDRSNPSGYRFQQTFPRPPSEILKSRPSSASPIQKALPATFKHLRLNFLLCKVRILSFFSPPIRMVRPDTLQASHHVHGASFPAFFTADFAKHSEQRRCVFFVQIHLVQPGLEPVEPAHSPDMQRTALQSLQFRL
jgi:hypothetical protein